MATVTKPIALDESFNTTEVTPRNIADVLAEELGRLGSKTASDVMYDNTDSGLVAENVQDALDEINGKVVQSDWEQADPTADDYIKNKPTTDLQTAVDTFSTLTGGLLSEAKLTLAPIQDLHGYDSPWVGGAGKNLLPTIVSAIKSLNTSGTWSGNVYTQNGNTFEILTDDADNVLGIKVNGTNSTSGDNVFFIQNRSLSGFTLPVGSYYINGVPQDAPNNSPVIRFQATRNGSGVTLAVTSGYGTGILGSVQSGDTLQVTIVVGGNATVNNLIYQPMLRKSTESDFTFESYSNICPISGHTEVELDVSDDDSTTVPYVTPLGTTIYMANIEMVSGGADNLTAEVVMNGSESWNIHPAISHGFYCDNVIPTGLVMDSTKDDTAISNMYTQNRYDVATSMDNGKFAYGLTGGTVRRFILRDDRFDTVAELTTALASDNLKLVMNLATPQHIQLSPQLIQTLVGENNLSAPLEGQTIDEVKYKQMFTFDDVIAYIQSLS